MRVSTFPRMTVAEYLALEAASEVKHEYVNGEIYAMSGASLAHCAIQSRVHVALATRLGRGRCEAYGSDLRVVIDETGLYTHPDVTVVCGKLEMTADHPPSLLNPRVLVEVLSPSTADWDRGGKAAHYRHRPSVDVVLLVDSRARMVELQTRNADGTWTLSERTEGDVVLGPLGISIPVDELYDGVELEAG